MDEPGLLARLRANVRPPMTMEEHVQRLEALYTELLERRTDTQGGRSEYKGDAR